MAALSEYVLEPLREGGEFTLYRGRQQGDSTPVLAVAAGGPDLQCVFYDQASRHRHGASHQPINH